MLFALFAVNFVIFSLRATMLLNLNLGEELGPHLTQCGLGQGLPPYKWHLNPSNCLAIIHQRYRQTERQTERQTDRTTLL